MRKIKLCVRAVYADGITLWSPLKRLLTYDNPMIRGVYIEFEKDGRYHDLKLS